MIEEERRRLRVRYVAYAALACAISVVVVGWLCWAGSSTTLVLLRHAEKEAGSNPGLTSDGAERAEELVRALADAHVSAVYATEWCRTTETADPLAVERSLAIKVQDTTPEVDQLAVCDLTATVDRLPSGVATTADLIDHILDEHGGETVVVVGHSNTVPDMVEALGFDPLCPGYFPLVDGDCRIPDSGELSEYDNLFVVSVPGWALLLPKLIKLRYGE